MLLLARLLRILNSETDPGQIGLAVALACVFGLTPLWTLHNLIVLLLVLVLRVNLASFLFAWALFTAFAYALDPAFDLLGHAVLTADALRPMWAALYASDLARLAEFNNTVVMGSLLASIGLAVALYFATTYALRQYRRTILAWLEQQRFYRIVTRLRVLRLYSSLGDRS